MGGKLLSHDYRVLEEEEDAELLQQAQEALSHEVLAVSLVLVFAVVSLNCMLARLRIRVEPRQSLVDLE